ncbi:Alpha/Beta hydrolase protein [Clohesyomyces aquaticus]|uniref:Alpha/Beta hydrolase protein n=1 Tax=Clohesyomyces aquaticus TaxID=1231657 RepID=A0A1Y1ZCF9_9PLEO|nr:Alpha/Beta hydrolase protein [Clohesyomyces aquaticus]
MSTPIPTPFHISIPQEKLDWIQARISSYPWHTLSSFDPTWSSGPPPADLRTICDHWNTSYSWRRTEERINALPNYKAVIQDLSIHFIHEKGTPRGTSDSKNGRRPRALLLLHGWPYSFHSYTDLIPRLAHPERFGGNKEDAFDVVVPSFPGFGFSQIKEPMNPKACGEIFNELMVDVLGYETYLAHGGDWGASTSQLLAYFHPESCVGISLTMSVVRHHGGMICSGDVVGDASEEEKRHAELEKEIWDEEKAYNLLQSTRPLKLAYAMMDSPVGVAAWLLEAWYAWSDLSPLSGGTGKRSLTELYTLDALIDEVMIYLVTETSNTSTWIYAKDWKEHVWTLPEGEKIEVPTAFIKCPDPVFPLPPRGLLERIHRRIVRWREADRGGHYLMYENPEVVFEELVGFGRVMDGEGQ